VTQNVFDNAEPDPTVPGMTLEKLNAMIKSENIWHEGQVALDLSRYEATARTEKARHDFRLQELEMIITTLKSLPRGEQ